MEKTAETTCRALILSVMVRMMEVDGIIDPREVKRIGDLYEEIAGFRLSDRIREKLIGSVTVYENRTPGSTAYPVRPVG